MEEADNEDALSAVLVNAREELCAKDDEDQPSDDHEGIHAVQSALCVEEERPVPGRIPQSKRRELRSPQKRMPIWPRSRDDT